MDIVTEPERYTMPVRERRAPTRTQSWAVLALGLVAVTGSIRLAMSSDTLVRPAVQSLLSAWITCTFVGSGVLAWRRRPASRFGPLLLLAGALWVLTTLQWSNHSAVSALGHLFDMVVPAVFLHVFLAYPTGRLEGRTERALVLACYVAGTGLQVLKIGLGVTPEDVLVVAPHPEAAQWVERAQLVTVSTLLLAGTVRVLVRRRSLPPVAHDRSGRVRSLLVDAFGLALAMLAALLLLALFGGPSFEAFRHLTFFALGLAPVAFLAGLLDARLARSDVGAFLVELRTDPTQDLQAPLARVLHDPTVRVAYWLPEYAAWSDQDGNPLSLPEQGAGRAVRIISREGSPIAALDFDPTFADEHELLDAVDAAAGIALENARLRAELRARLEELRGSRARMIEAGQRERRRLERDLHDGAQQRLVNLSLELGLLGRAEHTDAETRGRLLSLREEVSASLEELRDVAHGIHPAVLSGHGLAVALEQLAASAPLPVALDIAPHFGRLPEPVETAAYYLVSESLANIGKHAEADHAWISLVREGPTLVVTVVDDGRGGADTDAGVGLRGLADRVEALDGRVHVWSPPGAGTTLRAAIPCGS